MHEPISAARPTRRTVLLGAAGVAAAGGLAISRPGAAHAAAYGPSTMYTPPANAPAPKVLYPRALQLKRSGSANGTMLATFEQYAATKPSFPIFRSTNGGVSWSQYSTVTDTVNGWGLRYQPFLYELPSAVGSYPAGTVVCIGNSIPDDLSQTKLDVYVSADAGKTWRFVSSIARGGRAQPQNGQTPVWEPFALAVNGRLSVYYSDQRDPAYGQKLCHQTTTNLVNWGSVANDVTSPDYGDRPGMPTIAALPNGQWIMTYEYPGAPEGGLPVYYRFSNNPESWNSAAGHVLRTMEGQIPSSSPYVGWIPTGGPQGTIIVAANGETGLFLNTNGGADNLWVKVQAPAGGGYSRSVVPLSDNTTVFTMNAGPIGGSSNIVTYGAVELGSTISSGSTYTLFNRNSNLVMGVEGSSKSAGAAILQTTNTGAADRRWKLERQSSGYWRIRNVNSGLVLGVTGQSMANAARVVQWDDNGTADHDWVAVPFPGGGFVFANRRSGKRLEVADASTQPNAPVQQYGDTMSACQAWRLG